MKKKIKNEVIYKQMPVATREIEVFEASDGEEFLSEIDCINHEKFLEIKNNSLITYSSIRDNAIYEIPKIIFNMKDYEFHHLFVFKYNKELYNKIKDYYKQVKHFNFENLSILKPEDITLAFVITEDESSDYPTYVVKVIKLDDLYLILDKLFNDIKKYLDIRE